MEQRLLALGLDAAVAREAARDEFSDEAAALLCGGDTRDERVLPHPHGWIVTADIDPSDAELFERLEEATGRALARSAVRDGSGVLVYSPQGRIEKRIHVPGWR